MSNFHEGYADIVSTCDDQVHKITGEHLYSNQAKALQVVLGHLLPGNILRTVISMPTGSGKTRFASSLILTLHQSHVLELGSVVLFLTPRQVIREQAHAEFLNVLDRGNPSTVFSAQKIDGENWTACEQLGTAIYGIKTKITILTLTPQLLNFFFKKYDMGRLSNVKAIFLDEVHHTYCGHTTSKLITDLASIDKIKLMIGLSATPTKDGIDLLWKPREFVNPLYSFTSKEAMDLGILTKRLRILSYDTIVQLKDPNPIKDEWAVAVKERAQKYSKETIKILEPKRDDIGGRFPKTLIAASSTTEANLIYHELKVMMEKGEIRPKFPLLVAHYKTEDEAKETIGSFQNKMEGILVTVNMADIGYDDRNLEVLVIAKPINTPVGYIQLRGRVLRRPERECEPNLKTSKEALIIDFTNAAKFEGNVNSVENGQYGRLYSSNELEADLKGRGDVPEASGHVTLTKFKEIMVGQENAKQVPIIMDNRPHFLPPISGASAGSSLTAPNNPLPENNSEIRKNMEYNEPSISVLPAAAPDYEELDVNHLAAMLNEDAQLSDCLLKLIEQSDLYMAIPSQMDKLAEFLPSLDKSTLSSKIYFLRFRGLVNKRKDSMEVTELGIRVASVSKSSEIEAMIFDRAKNANVRLLTILDMKTSGFPEAVIFRTIDRLHDQGKLFYPTVNGFEFKLLWVTEPSDLNNPDIKIKISKMVDDLSSHVLNVLSHFYYPLSEEQIVKELRGTDVVIGKETVHYLTTYLSSINRITKDGNQWFYPYAERLKDRLKSRPNEILTVDEMMKAWAVPNWKKSEIQDVINNAEKKGRVARIIVDRWVSGAIDKKEQLTIICSQLVLDRLKSSKGPIPKGEIDCLLRRRRLQFFSQTKYMPENPNNFTEGVLSDLIKSKRIVLDAKGIGRGACFQ